MQIISVLAFTAVVQGTSCFIASAYLWRISKNSTAAWWLLSYFIGLFITNILLFVMNVIPFWGILSNSAQGIPMLIAMAGLSQFAYHYPELDQPREATLVKIVFLLLLTIQTIYYTIFAYSFIFKDTYLPTDTWVPAIMIMGTLTTMGTFIRRYLFYVTNNIDPPITPLKCFKFIKSSNSKANMLRDISPIGLLPLIIALGIGFGLNEHIVVMMSALISINGIMLIYIHHSAEQTSFIVKLVGTSLLIISIIVGAIGIDSITNTVNISQEGQAKHLKQLLLSQDLNALPPEVLAVFEWPINDPTPKKIYTSSLTLTLPPKSITPETAYTWREYSDFQTQQIYDILVIATPTTIYEIAMLNPEFKLKLHQVSVKLILQFIMAVFLLIVGLPFFLQYNLMRPMNKLLAGVQQANLGNLNIYIPVQHNDEIGILTHSFNTSMASIRRAEQEHARLNAIEQELNLAHQMQNSLLPPSRPNWPQLDALCFTTPAKQVGGDFYQYYSFLSESVTNYSLAIGDVSGKGVPAALLMAITLASLGTVMQHDLSPAELLTQLDVALLPYTQKNRQNCAMCYVEISQMTQHYYLRVANAGCVAPLIKRHTGRVEWLDIGGIPLGTGLSQTMPYEQIELLLTPGDMLILTTDGIIEAKNERHELYGFPRLETAVQASPIENSTVMLEYLKQDVLAFVGQTEQHDDMSIIVIKV